MLKALEISYWLLTVAVAGVFIFGFVRSRNPGFLLLMIGIPFVAVISRFLFPLLFSLSHTVLTGLRIQDRMQIISSIPALIGSAFVLAGALLLTLGANRAQKSPSQNMVDQAPLVSSDHLN